MVHVQLDSETYKRLRAHLADHGIKADRPRWVLHLDVDDADTTRLCAAVEAFERE